MDFGRVMKIKDLRVLLIDAQTTGMRPPQGHLLELAWTLAAASDQGEPKIQSHLLKLPDGQTVPKRVSDLTGITDADLLHAESRETVLRALNESEGKMRSSTTLSLKSLFSRICSVKPTL